MNNTKLPLPDPIGAYQRQATAARRIGDRQCSTCSEARPEALITDSNPTICQECQRKRKGHTTMDNSHTAGKANNPATIRVPANDHIAVLSVAQYGWPRETLQNPEGCFLLAAAGCVRGLIDHLRYLIDKFLLWIPEMLEKLSAFLREQLGPKWWVGTPLQQFAPRT
jgi:hypothetical protein